MPPTVKMLSCLTEPTDGEAFLNGRSIVKDPQAVKAVIGVSPQETAVASGLSVLENLEMMCGVYGLSKDKQRQKIAELTERLGLDAVGHKKALGGDIAIESF
jgi:ABC-2 type transport system ATP-binding protein